MAKLTFAPRITRDRDSGDFLSEVVEWDGDQEVNVVFVGWFDTHALALSAANEEATDYYTKQAASELADEAVYCEACGHEVDPAVAVLNGELMVCPGCAPCSDAEFEAMQQAEADHLMAAEMAALVPDPETWQAVSEVPCAPDACNVCGSDGSSCVECNPITHPYLMTGSPCAPEHRCDLSRELSRRVVFDALCQATDELRDYWRDVPRRVEAINIAWEWVMLQPVYHFNAQGDLLVPSGSDPSKVYAVGHSCPCTAGRWGNHCRHSVIADIIGRAVRIARLKAA